MHTKLYGRSYYLSMFCSGSSGTLSQQRRELNITKNAGSLYNKDKTNIELSSIYIGIWPHYIGNPHTNERGLSAGIDRLPRACSTSLADLSSQLHATFGVAEIYICNTRGFVWSLEIWRTRIDLAFPFSETCLSKLCATLLRGT